MPIEALNRLISGNAICQAVFGCPYSEREASRLYHHIHRIRPKLAAFGLSIACLNKGRGYILLRAEEEDVVDATH